MPETTRGVRNMFNDINRNLRFGLEEYHQSSVEGGHKNYDVIFFVRDYDNKAAINWHASETNSDLPEVFEAMMYESLCDFCYSNDRNCTMTSQERLKHQYDTVNNLPQEKIDEFYDWFIQEIWKAKDRRFSKPKEDDDHDHL